MPRRPLLILTALLWLAPPVAGEDPPGWRDPVPQEALSAYLEPLELPLRSTSGFERILSDLTGRRAWSDLAKTLDARLQEDPLRGALVRSRQPGSILQGALPATAERLRRMPRAVLSAYRHLKAPEARKLFDAGRLAELVDRYPGSELAPQSARLLGERALERGELEDACLHWRTALLLDPAQPLLRRRLLTLRARPSAVPDRPGALGVALPRPEGPSVRWVRREVDAAGTRRPVAADGQAVYFSDRRGVLAADRASGVLRWRFPLQEVRALVCGERLLAVSRGELVAIEGGSGEPVWRCPLAALGARGDVLAEDGFVAAQPDGQDTVALLSLAGDWRLVSLDRAGKVRWVTRLWTRRTQPYIYAPLVAIFDVAQSDPCRNPEDTEGSCPARAGKPGVHPERDQVGVRVRSSGPHRRVLGDGALDLLGGRAFVTVDGVVFSVGLARGELQWLRARLRGLAVGGTGSVHVSLHVQAYAVEAVTAAGLLARLDPLDGSTLATPLAPEEADAVYRPVYRLGSDPLILGWGPGATDLAVGVDGRRLGRSAGPLEPGASWQGVLALPTPGALELWDPRSKEHAPQRVLWPLRSPARPVAVPGALLLVGPDFVALLAPGEAPSLPAPPTRLGVEHLDAVHWSTRLAAREALAEALSRDDPALLARLEEAALTGSLERREASALLVGAYRRRVRWRKILPGVSAAELRRITRDLRPAKVRELGPKLAPRGDQEAIHALAAEVLSTDEPELRGALFQHLLRLDRRTQGAVVAKTRTTLHAGAQRAGADFLVRLASEGHGFAFLKLLQDDALSTFPDGAGIRALIAHGDEQLWEKHKPPNPRMDAPFEAFQVWFRQNPGPAPDPGALLEELEPFLKARAE